MRNLLLVCALLWSVCASAQETEDAQVIPAEMDQLSLPNVDQPSVQPIQQQPRQQPQQQVIQPQPQSQQQQRPVLQQKPPRVFKKREYKLWTGFFTLGLALSQGTTYTVNTAGGTTATSQDKGNAGVMFGFEGYRELMSYFLLGAVIEYSSYPYQVAGVSSDSALGFYVMPRIEAYADLFTFWGGLGLGLMRLGVGTPTSSLAPGVTLSSSAIGIAISPRVGAEYEFMRNWFAGAELNYVRFSGSLGVSTTSSSTSDFSIGFVRHWIAFATRIGLKF